MKRKTLAYLAALLLTVFVFACPAMGETPAEQAGANTHGEQSQEAARQGYSFILHDIPQPQIGVPLAEEAEVSLARDGVATDSSWKLPLFWLDAAGEEVKVPERNEDYQIVLVFYIPEEFQPEDWEDQEPLLFAENGEMIDYVVLSNPELGLRYITWKYINPLKTQNQAPLTAYRVYDGPYGADTAPAGGKAAPDDRKPAPDSGSDEADPGKTEPENPDPGQEEEKDTPAEKPVSWSKYVDKEAKDHWKILSENERTAYVENIRLLEDIVVNKIQPQAVRLLMNNLPVLKKAVEEGRASKYVSLYISYSQSGYGAMETTCYLGTDGLGLDGSNGRSAYDDQIWNIGHKILINSNSYPKVSDSSQRAEFEGAVVHEMMHAFMNDIARNGSVGLGRDGRRATLKQDGVTVLDKDGSPTLLNRFPMWFEEGMAVSVQAGFSDRLVEFVYIFGGSLEEFKKEIRNPDRLAEWYEQPASWGDNAYIYEPGNVYNMGYVACMYLYSLAADTLGEKTFVNQEDKAAISVNKKALRDGLNLILDRLDNGYSLDEIITSISPKLENGEPFYNGTKGFEQYFMVKGDSGTEFASDFFQAMMNESDLENMWMAGGSVLDEIKKGSIPFMEDTPQEAPPVYKIVNIDNPKDDADYYAVSTVKPSDTVLSAGKSKDYAYHGEQLTDEDLKRDAIAIGDTVRIIDIETENAGNNKGTVQQAACIPGGTKAPAADTEGTATETPDAEEAAPEATEAEETVSAGYSEECPIEYPSEEILSESQISDAPAVCGAGETAIESRSSEAADKSVTADTAESIAAFEDKTEVTAEPDLNQKE